MKFSLVTTELLAGYKCVNVSGKGLSMSSFFAVGILACSCLRGLVHFHQGSSFTFLLKSDSSVTLTISF